MQTKYILILFIIFSGCTESDIENINKDDYLIRAEKNEIQWEASGGAILDKGTELGIQATVVNEYNYLRELLVFSNLEFKTGRQEVSSVRHKPSLNHKYSSYATHMADGDVIDDYYYLLESEQNYININSIDSVNLRIKGTFQVTFIRDSTENVINPDLPDAICFKNGEFTVMVNEHK